MNLLTKILVPVVVLVLAVTALVAFVFGGEHQKTLTADFPRTVSLYEGSDLRVLGVPIGKVDSVTPSGTQVVVTMHYDADVQIPADAKAVIISPSIVGDRFVQLMEDSDVLFRALVARREAVHDLLVSSTTLSKELTRLIEQSRADLEPALAHLENVVAVLNKNEDNLDSSLRLMAPFYRVFANTLGTGPWFDTWISNFPPVPQVG